MSSLWRTVFGDDHPVEIEIGPGRGDVLCAFAASRPNVNFFAIEHAAGAAAGLAARLARERLDNARVIAGDARCIVTRLVPPGSVQAYHVYFPDPWPKRRHARRRLFDAPFATAIATTLTPAGRLHVATDLSWLFHRIVAVVEQVGFRSVDDRPTPMRPVTKFERKYAPEGAYTAQFRYDPRLAGGAQAP